MLCILSGEQSLQAVVAFTALKLEMGWQTNRIGSKSLNNLLGNTNKNVLEKTVEEARSIYFQTGDGICS